LSASSKVKACMQVGSNPAEIMNKVFKYGQKYHRSKKPELYVSLSLSNGEDKFK
jgi:hypothetical protein